VLLIARGLPFRETFALRRPQSWTAAAAIGAATLTTAYAISFTEVTFIPDLAREQSVPEFWDPTRLVPWLVNLLVIALFVPVFEEALCRGLGYALFAPFGPAVAVAVTAVAFTLAHGVLFDFPVILTTGLGLGCLRAVSGSLYPCLALHAVFNGFGLAAAAFFSGAA
jgi:membrane protease YdiL (CAAX protease family)